MLVEAGRARAAYLLLVFGASFLAAYTVNSQAFQRYFDPPVLLFIGWCLVLTIRPGNSADERRVLATSALVFLMQCVFSFWTIYRPLFMSNG